jgi:hypothetical protein
MGRAKVQCKYLQSKINRDFVEQFEIHESIIGFNHSDFRDRIRHEMSYIGLDAFELASKCYVSENRMQYLLAKNVEFLPNEISSIKKILGM